MKEMNLMFEKQRKEMEKMQKEMMRDEKGKRKTSVQILKKEECVYNVSMGNYLKNEIQIGFNDGILAISGQKKVEGGKSSQMGNFYYAFSVPESCLGSPDVNYGKKEIEVKFQVKKENS
jgi:hypothetical protein